MVQQDEGKFRCYTHDGNSGNEVLQRCDNTSIREFFENRYALERYRYPGIGNMSFSVVMQDPALIWFKPNLA
jgi:hypothetical protein